MKSLSDLDHYDVLEVLRDASTEEVERAYRLARATYGHDSLAVYSIYDDVEAGAIRDRIDEAWRVLSDPRSRDAYDASLPSREGDPELPLEITLAFESGEHTDAVPELEALEEDPDAGFDGARLRRARLHRGIDLEQIAQVTKISATYLHFIEEERFDDLPAPVYVRGFVRAYARFIGLDADAVVASYMERFQAAREHPMGRGRRGR